MEDNYVPAGMKHYELPAGEETLDFHGRLIYSVDNDRGDRPRWAELRLYKIYSSEEDKELWLLYTIGHTMVYHCLGAECNRGIVLRAGDFPERAEDPEGLEPCVICNPAEWSDASEDKLFELEVTWYTYTPCATPDKVYEGLLREPRCKHCMHKPHETYSCSCGCGEYSEAPRTLSTPGRRLWEQSKLLDPEIAKAASKKVKF